jgi:4-amino-4-deoxy-L-arabinose transferase-like glycosyltransferase
MKKYEPGGNLDTIWYAAIARNISQSGNFFRFFISKYYLNPIYDHMPLTSWITAFMFNLFGISDFVARLYPMVCSFLTYLVLYLTGCLLGGQARGLAALVCLGLCFEFTKWNGSLMHDVPLAFYLLASAYSFIHWRKNKRSVFYLSSLFFVLGVWTKGPIIFCLPLGLFLHTIIYKDLQFLRSRYFVLSFILSLFLLSILCWKPFYFEGRNYYSIFMDSKRSYLMGSTVPMGGVFTYLLEFLKKASIPLAFFVFGCFKRNRSNEQNLLICILVSLVVPLSLASVKFPHYMIPAYPILALIASEPLTDWFKKHQNSVCSALNTLSILTLMAMIFFPIKITGKRTKETLNLVNLMKFDTRLKEKKSFFLGTWETDMAIFQTMKFYGNIDLIPISKNESSCPDFDNSQIIIPINELPLTFCKKSIVIQDCLAKNTKYCLITGRNTTQWELPTVNFPHELY